MLPFCDHGVFHVSGLENCLIAHQLRAVRLDGGTVSWFDPISKGLRTVKALRIEREGRNYHVTASHAHITFRLIDKSLFERLLPDAPPCANDDAVQLYLTSKKFWQN